MLEKDYLYEVAKTVDNDFIGTQKTFTADKGKEYYILTTNLCDSASIIRAYVDGDKIVKLTRIGPDTESYQEVQPETYKRVGQIVL